MELSPVGIPFAGSDPYGHEATGKEATKVSFSDSTSEYGCGVQMILRKAKAAEGRQEDHFRARVPLAIETGDLIGQGGAGHGFGFFVRERADESRALGLEDRLRFAGIPFLPSLPGRQRRGSQEGEWDGCHETPPRHVRIRHGVAPSW